MMEQKIRIIAKEKLFEMMENKEDFILVEVLSQEDYDKGHIPFAVNIPAGDLGQLAPKILPDKQQCIVVYCSDFLCTASSGAARFLQSQGYDNVFDYKGGKGDWEKAGLPLIPS